MRAHRQVAGVGDLVDDRDRAIEAVADQDGIIAAHDHTRDGPALLAGGDEPARGVGKRLVADDREDRSALRIARQICETPERARRRAATRWRIAGGARDGVAGEVDPLDAAKLAQLAVDGAQLCAHDPVDGGADPPLGQLEQQQRARSGGRRALAPAGRPAPDAEPLGRTAGLEPGDRELGRRVADVASADDHGIRPRRTYASQASRTSAAQRGAPLLARASASCCSSGAVDRPGRSDS